jgi:hypothetical protein
MEAQAVNTRRNPPPLIALRPMPKRATQGDIDHARRAIETSGAGALQQAGMMARLDAAAARLGLKSRRP